MKKCVLITVLSLVAGLLNAASPAIKVESIQALAGTENAEVRLLADTDVPVEALAVSGSFDADLTFRDITIDGTLLGTGRLDAEWFNMKFEPGTSFSAAVIVDIFRPYAGRVLSAGVDQHVFNVYFDVATGLAADEQLSITLLDRAGDPAIVTVFTVDGESVIPARVNGEITIVAPPDVTGVSPQLGPVAGGTALTITGQYFTDDTSVTIGGQALLDLTVVNETTIRGAAPAHAAGPVSAVAENSWGSDTLTNAFTYVPPPTITSITPQLGLGDVEVTITGTNFTTLADTSILFGGTAVSPVTQVTATQIVCQLPSCESPSGWIEITVTTTGGTVTLTDGYQCAITFRRGDGNCDDTVNLADAIFLLDYLFVDAEALCLKALDSNDDGTPDLSDAVYVIRHLFGGAAAPPAPFPNLGLDPTEDTLDCAAQCGS